jgi:DNA-binding NarL/FixJ family response regulator
VMKTRVLVAHEDPLLSAGIAASLVASMEFDVVVPESGRRDVSGVRDVDVVIADFARALHEAERHDKVLVLARDDSGADVRTALRLGVRGFLVQRCSIEELVAAIRAVADGHCAFAPSVAATVVESLGYEELSTREVEVLRFIMVGFCDKGIAREMGIAMGTVKSHVKSILAKLGAARRTEAAAIAQRRGIARMDWELIGTLAGTRGRIAASTAQRHRHSD